MIKEYIFHGYDEYFDYRDEIKKFISSIVPDEKMRFLIALNEVVNNAGRHSLDGYDNCVIRLRLRFDDNILTCIVSSTPSVFDGYSFLDKLQNIASEHGDLVWSDYLIDATSGRGIWTILEACDMVYLAHDGRAVFMTLNLPLPDFSSLTDDEKNNRYIESRKIKNLIGKLFISCGDEMVV